MTYLRAERVAEEIQKEVSRIIQFELKDPRIGFVTVTGVELSNDLRNGKIYVSIYGSEAEKKATLLALENATGHIRSEIGKRIRLKHIPELIFRFDKSVEHGARISQLLREVKQTESRTEE